MVFRDMVADAALRERERMRAIMSSHVIAGRQRWMRHIAFECDLSAEEAIAIIERAPMDPDGADQFGTMLEEFETGPPDPRRPLTAEEICADFGPPN